MTICGESSAALSAALAKGALSDLYIGCNYTNNAPGHFSPSLKTRSNKTVSHEEISKEKIAQRWKVYVDNILKTRF